MFVAAVCIIAVTACGSGNAGTAGSTGSMQAGHATAGEASATTSETSAAEESGTATSDTESTSAGNIAGADEMTDVIEVVEEGMVPVVAEELADGEYDIEMKSSSSMFKADHVKLRVEDGTMQAVLYMTSKSYRYMFAGTAQEAAAAQEADFILPEDADGDMTTFTLPVAALDTGIDAAAFSKKKEKWYDRTLLFRADSLPDEAFKGERHKQMTPIGLAQGTYTVEVTLSGGSGRAGVSSPAKLTVDESGATAELIWNSPNYDFMMVNGTRYDPVQTEGNSVFLIPVDGFDYAMPVQADTTAMSQPYLIDYTLTFDSASVREAP